MYYDNNPESVIYWVAEQSDVVVGALTGVLIPSPPYPEWIDCRDCYVHLLFVDAGFRGFGLGSALLEVALSEAYDLKIRRFLLNSVATAQNLYRRNGFHSEPMWMVYDSMTSDG